MTRTIVSVFNDGDHISFNLYQSPGDFPEARNLYTLTCTGSEQPFINLNTGQLDEQAVQCAGQILFDTLLEHPAVHDALSQALASPRGTLSPIYLYLNSDRAEALPWETLYSSHSHFLALDKRWPIARIVDSSAFIPVIERTLKSLLKIMVVLAAASVDALPQWQAFYAAIKSSPFPLTIEVFACQDEVVQTVTALNNPHIQAHYLADKDSFFEAIGTFAPHILHFFCHGSTEGGTHLELATRADWQGEDSRGSVTIEPNELRQITTLDNDIWLVTLNSCLGAAPVEDAHSLARALVTQGFPAVVGMREVIAADDAHTFCRAFYEGVLKEIARSKEQAQEGVTVIEWADALQAPRTQLCAKYSRGRTLTATAAVHKAWTLPIIYIRPEPFTLRIRTTNPLLNAHEQTALQVELDTLRQGRAFMQTLPGVPQSVFDEIDQRITNIEKNLYTSALD